MSKKIRFASAMAVSLFSIGLCSLAAFHTSIETNGSLDASVTESTDTKKTKMETDQYGAGYGLIQVEHFNSISYPAVKQFGISLMNHSAVPVYGTVSANLGKISKRRIFLESGKLNQLTYDVPDGFDAFKFDEITFEFYDGHSRLVDEFRTTISYNEDTKQIEVFDYSPSSGAF